MSRSHHGPLAVTCGDPRGVGPIVAVRALASFRPASGALLFGPEALLRALAVAAGLRIGRGPGAVRLLDVGPPLPAHGEVPLDVAGAVQLAALRAGVGAVLSGEASALVTAPVSKEAVARHELDFRGQTEWLASAAGRSADAVTMMFLGARLRVALVTTHLPLAEVSEAVRPDRLWRTLAHLGEALERLATEPPIRLLVCGLDPHLGEGGLIGRLDAERLAPVVCRFAEAHRGCVEVEHLPAETAFRMAAAGEADGVVAMYHDQATVPSKLLDWGSAVNVTWGLPFVRTSPDHGVGLRAVRQGKVDAAGMEAALRMAERLLGGSAS